MDFFLFVHILLLFNDDERQITGNKECYSFFSGSSRWGGFALPYTLFKNTHVYIKHGQHTLWILLCNMFMLLSGNQMN